MLSCRYGRFANDGGGGGIPAVKTIDGNVPEEAHPFEHTTYIATKDFGDSEGACPGDLQFKVDDVLQVYHEGGAGGSPVKGGRVRWYQGWDADGKEGAIPASFVERVEPIPDEPIPADDASAAAAAATGGADAGASDWASLAGDAGSRGPCKICGITVTTEHARFQNDDGSYSHVNCSDAIPDLNAAGTITFSLAPGPAPPLDLDDAAAEAAVDDYIDVATDDYIDVAGDDAADAAESAASPG